MITLEVKLQSNVNVVMEEITDCENITTMSVHSGNSRYASQKHFGEANLLTRMRKVVVKRMKMSRESDRLIKHFTLKQCGALSRH